VEKKDISDGLMSEVKQKLYISWDEDDEQIKNIILRAATYIQTKVSETLSFDQGTPEYDLLLERCRYDWNSALDEFERNYSSEIVSFIQHYALVDWRRRHGVFNGE
jgi:hypothetical protein